MALADPMLSRAKGCLLGHLAGDSLGGLVEFRDADDIAAEFPEGVRELRDGGHWGLLAGQPTDDGELTLALARSLVRQGRYEPGAALDAYVPWLKSGPFDIGGTTRQALASAAAGQHRPSAGSQANGSLMRAAPIGIFAAGRPGIAADFARIDSGLTHPNDVCRDACAAYCAAIASAIGAAAAGGSDAAGAAGGLPAGAAGRRQPYDVALQSARTPEVRDVLRRAESAPPDDYQTNMGWVLIALQNAFHQLLHAASAEEGVVASVMAGGDTDTNAAIAGALLGAAWGCQALPDQWRSVLSTCRPQPGTATRHPRPAVYWPCDAESLAEALLACGRGSSEPRPVGA